MISLRITPLLLSTLALVAPQATQARAQTDSCLSEINGSLKGQPGNVQDNTFHSLLIDPLDENIVYVGTEANGMFKTTNGGVSWIRLRRGLKCTSNQTGYSQIFDITADPANTKILYASGQIHGQDADSAVGLIKSVDDGRSWQVMNPPGVTISGFDSLEKSECVLL